MANSTLDSAITKHARKLFSRRQKAEALAGRIYSSRTLAREMAQHLFPDETEEKQVGAVHKTLVHYLGEGVEKRPWRLDYLDAFARAMNVSPADLFAADFRAGSEAAYDGEAWYLMHDVLALHDAAEREQKRWIRRSLDAVRSAAKDLPALQAIVHIGTLLAGQVRPPDAEPVEGEQPQAPAAQRRKVRAR